MFLLKVPSFITSDHRESLYKRLNPKYKARERIYASQFPQFIILVIKKFTISICTVLQRYVTIKKRKIKTLFNSFINRFRGRMFTLENLFKKDF